MKSLDTDLLSPPLNAFHHQSHLANLPFPLLYGLVHTVGGEVATSRPME